MVDIKTGLYKHFKGGTVFVYAIEKSSEDGAPMRVGYIGIQDGKCCSRPVDSFLEKVKNAEGELVPRFALVKETKVDLQTIIPNEMKKSK